MQEQDRFKEASEIHYQAQGPLSQNVDENHGGQKLYVIKNTEERFWESLRKGDQNALGELYKLHVESMFAFGSSITKDRNYVMDCIHDLFLDLYKYRKGLSPVENVKYYLLKSLKRKINRKYHSKTMPFSTMEPNYRPEDRHGFTTSHEEQLIDNECIEEKNEKLSEALDTLTKKQRRSLMLKFTEQRTYKEISEIMGVSIESARTAVYRALKSFR
ncbi:MAG: RNA polymerase sigma factor [Flagellimonas sp.]